MFKLNLKIALRSLWKNKISSLINVTGLAIGLAACLMLMIYVLYEWNFDKQSANADRVYVTMTNIRDDSGKIFATFNGSTTAFGPMVKQEIPEAKYVCRMDYGGKGLIANGDKAFKKSSKFAEPAILKMFSYQFISGDPNTALNNPNSVILTASTAKILFGTTEVLDRSVLYLNKYYLKVTAVVGDLPENSSNKFDFLMPWSFYESVDEEARDLNWNNYSFVTLVMLDRGGDILQVNKKVDELVRKNSKQATQPHFLFPLTEMHLYGKFEDGQSVGGDIEQIWLFMGLAIGILLIACINFMNMATAKSEKRAKEVGIKKTIGANRSMLVAQFLTESIVLTLISLILAIALIEASLPLFNNLLNIKMEITYFDGYIWTGLLAIVLGTGLIAGSYPALYLSAFNPIQTLKRNVTGRHFLAISLRQVLVVSQFSFTIILIIATLVIYKQIQYIKNRPVGFNANALVELPQEGELGKKFELFKTKLLQSGAVSSMYQSSISLSHHGSNFTDIAWPGMSQAQNTVLFNRIGTAYDFIKTNQVKLLQGRDFSERFASDTAALLVSASAAKVMGLKNPIGENVKIFGDKYTVIGVFDDYVWDSPYKSNNPMVIQFNKGWKGNITMRLNAGNSLQENISTITKITKEINPAYPVELNFISTVYAEKLQKERTLGTLSNLFGGLAIFISCMGLFGLVVYSAEQRTKEFGIRKVLGASVTGLMKLLSVSFLKMIFVAMVLAVPIACYAMEKWLNNFEFHTTISWWIIAIAAAGTLLIAMITISLQAYKTAVSNPVDALKYE
ncbi:MAG TPA: ABC transporter permease [Pedobacter sp.]|uniref:ABC transporter permease n=1 Tax=Pedobacter sp. TaxID=1411316 RepID=UPI002CAB432D|nr:ABC transporter permease [Pedobacter sp.]HMI03441.1 ABC transporter permease [Pedobacter sp.]